MKQLWLWSLCRRRKCTSAKQLSPLFFGSVGELRTEPEPLRWKHKRCALKTGRDVGYIVQTSPANKQREEREGERTRLLQIVVMVGIIYSK